MMVPDESAFGLQVGDTLTWSRTFTEDETQQFSELSGDKGIHHVRRDASGHLMVHGLFTASVGTKLGGDLNYIARNMAFEFVRPVFTGDTITCVLTVESIKPGTRFMEVSFKSTYKNQEGQVVLTGTSQGIIRDAKEGQ